MLGGMRGYEQILYRRRWWRFEIVTVFISCYGGVKFSRDMTWVAVTLRTRRSDMSVKSIFFRLDIALEGIKMARVSNVSRKTHGRASEASNRDWSLELTQIRSASLSCASTMNANLICIYTRCNLKTSGHVGLISFLTWLVAAATCCLSHVSRPRGHQWEAMTTHGPWESTGQCESSLGIQLQQKMNK